MRIDVDHDERCLVIKEVFSGAFIETREGNRIGFCLRDGTVELNILPKNGGSCWFRIDMQNLSISPMQGSTDREASATTASDGDGDQT